MTDVALHPRVAPGDRKAVGVLTWVVARISGRVTGTTPPNVFLVLGRHKRLFRGWLHFAGRLMPGGTLPRRETELVILRVAHLRGCTYELDQHRRLAGRSGVTPAEIEQVFAGPDAPAWSPRERAILAAVDQLHHDRDLDDQTWMALRDHLDERGAIELVLLASHYEMLATAITTLRVPLDQPRGRRGCAALARLPKGRHSLTRQQVADAQRLRLAVAMAEAMAESGYVGTPVAAILRRAGVSRETFYQLYDDKHACFLDALDLVGAVLTAQLTNTVDTSGEPLERAEQAIERYLAALVEHPAFARLYLVEVQAAGPIAMQRRADLQERIVVALTGLFGARTAASRFACQAYVAAIASLVTVPVATGDVASIAALRRPLVAHLRALVQSGVISR